MTNSQRILITGGAGFIGSHLVRLMVQSGHQVMNVDKLTYAANLKSLADISELDNYQFCKLDIADGVRVREIFDEFQPDAVMHLAAESHVDRSIDGPAPFIETNIVGTFQLLQSALEYWRELPADRHDDFRFLHVSTDEVYGSLSKTDPAFTESTPYDPHSPYSASKASSDHLARAWFDTYELPVLVTNCSNNYGPFQFPEKLIPVVILKCLRGEPIPVYGQGENIRDWLYVEDHCQALATVLEKGTPGQTYNIGGNNEQKNLDLVKLICEILDEHHPSSTINKYEDLITFVTDRPGHDLRYAIDATKIKTDLGWEPKETFRSGFEKTVRWYLDNEPWWSAILEDRYQLQRLGSKPG